jgi:hypothetical protein
VAWLKKRISLVNGSGHIAQIPIIYRSVATTPDYAARYMGLTLGINDAYVTSEC